MNEFEKLALSIAEVNTLIHQLFDRVIELRRSVDGLTSTMHCIACFDSEPDSEGPST